MSIKLKCNIQYLTRDGKVIRITNQYKCTSNGEIIFSDKEGVAYTEKGTRAVDESYQLNNKNVYWEDIVEELKLEF
jgi:hypothetical protein